MHRGESSEVPPEGPSGPGALAASPAGATPVDSAWASAWRALKEALPEPPGTEYFLTRWLFLRLLGLIYLVAFASLWVQLGGLIGSGGILSAARFLEAVRHQTGLERYWLVPTFCWLNASNASLYVQCGLGVGAAILLVLDLAPGLMALLLWALYLSLASVSQVFLEYQWDGLLLETGLLAICLAPWQVRPCRAREPAPSRLVLWLLRCLLFRLMFFSGVVKLASGDPTWTHLTALRYHYETQPLPTPLAWYANQLPAFFQVWCVALMFVVELGLPWLIFAGRRFRAVAAILFGGFQVLIAATGNYCFFNLLTVALCVPLLDDGWVRRLLPRRFSAAWDTSTPRAQSTRWPRPAIGGLALVILVVSGTQSIGQLLGHRWSPFPARQLVQGLAPFRSINTYGLFSVMTTERLEIIVEGSNDREHWRPYQFKWKPGPLQRRPGWVAPHQPRLDWQMWFAALSDYRDTPWFFNFMVRLLQGSPPVLALLAHNPFPHHPPRYVRATLYRYHFTDYATRRLTGAWWWRMRLGPYTPILSMRRDSTPPSGDSAVP